MYKDIKTIDAVCKALGCDFIRVMGCFDELMKVNEKLAYSYLFEIIKEALNKGYKFSFTEGNIYYPVFQCTPITSNYYGDYIAKVEIYHKDYPLTSNIYYVQVDTVCSEYEGVGNNYNDSVMFCTPYTAILGCATKEIAEHMGKYFWKYILRMMYGDKFNIIPVK